jgi:uncharacterized membrane protein
VGGISMDKKRNPTAGIVLIIIGVLLLIKNMGIFDFRMSDFWPVIFIILGVAFHISYFLGKRTDPGLLIPGGLFLGLGITFQISVLFNIWRIMWPFILMSVAVGLFELYWFGKREKGLLIPVGILGGLSVIFLTQISLRHVLNNIVGRLFLPVILIILGLIVIFKGYSLKKNA